MFSVQTNKIFFDICKQDSRVHSTYIVEMKKNQIDPYTIVFSINPFSLSAYSIYRFTDCSYFRGT